MPPCDLIAERSGVIVGLEGVKGNIAVKVGDVVEEGSLLVGGRYGDEETGFRYMTAEGEVMAEVERSFSVRVPRKYQKKSYTGEVKYEKYLIFFEKEVKFFGNSGNLGSTCVKIIEDEILGFFGADLPVVLRTETEKEYTLELRRRSEQEARALALEGLEAQIKEQLGGAEILSRKNSFTVVNGVCRLECELVCLEDIAKTVEFEADFKN